MTERLYYQDPYMRTFQAHVVDRRQVGGRPAVVLDATAFYPQGGGQPYDTGTLNPYDRRRPASHGVRVVEVQVDQDGEIVHLLDGPLPEEGAAMQDIAGEIDWERRFDHMQQHTGQHILSQAFVQALDAATVGFHLGETLSTIDLDRAPLSREEVAEAVRIANRIVLEDRLVTARFVDAHELAALPLRKIPTVAGPIRIVEISEFDWSPCGGTHVRRSGQVGAIQVTRAERRKATASTGDGFIARQTRIHFLCGWRALADYDRKSEIIQALAAHFTTAGEEILPSVERLESEARDLRKRLAATQLQLLDHELAGWIAQAQRVGEVWVVRLALDGRDVSLLKEIARRLTERSGMVALLANTDIPAQLVFARSEDVSADMGGLMRTACAAAGGRGGGRPHFAQGSVPGQCLASQGSLADAALNQAMQSIAALHCLGQDGQD